MERISVSNLLKILLIAIPIAAFLPNPVAAQMPELINDREFRPDAQAAVDSIYNFNFRAADQLLTPWQEQYPDHPLWQLLDGMQLWWKVLSDLENTEHDDSFFDTMQRTDYAASKLLRQNNSHADALIIRTIANGYIARQFANREEWLSSIGTARKALNAYDYLSEVQPDLPDLNLAEGLKLYYADHLPDAYPIVRTVSWFLPEGDREQGLELMRETAERAIFARAEAIYFLGNINYHYEKDYDQAVGYFRQLYKKYPHNNYYARKLVGNLYRLKRYDEALQVIDESLLRWEANHLPFQKVLQEELLTWQGRIHLARGNREQARRSLMRAFAIGKELPRTQHRVFHVTSGYFLGKLLYEQTFFAEAEPYLQAIADSEVGEDYRNAARQMLRQINGN